jgi:hypothetical protein
MAVGRIKIKIEKKKHEGQIMPAADSFAAQTCIDVEAQ